MTFDEIEERFGKLEKNIGSSKVSDMMILIGNDALTLIRKRIQETGVNAQGGKFRAYSTEPMLVGKGSMNTEVANSFFGKENNKKHKWVTLNRFNRQGKKIRLAELEGGYKEFRSLHGRRIDITNFMFYGNMWSNIGIVSTPTEHGAGIVTIAARNEETRKILQGNANRRGRILELSKEELDMLKSNYLNWIRQIFNE